jgi:hypothetical protein
VDAKQHPVFRELTRVKQYFEKIKALETEPEERSMTLDKAAASRFIKHGLVSVDLSILSQWLLTKFPQSGNDKYDLERAEKQAKERARAQFKADMLARKSMEASKAQILKGVWTLQQQQSPRLTQANPKRLRRIAKRSPRENTNHKAARQRRRGKSARRH